METITTPDAAARLAELVDRAAHGETFEIMQDGRPVARLVPPEDAPAKTGRTFKDWVLDAPRLDDILPPRDRSPARDVEL